MEKKIKELFEKFLIDNNCYSQFVINLLESSNRTLDEYLDNHVSTHSYFLIDIAFM